jgi:hypothetical protein
VHKDLKSCALNPTTLLNQAPLDSLFSVGQKSAVVALLDAGYQLENVGNRQDLQGQDHREQAPKL